MKKEKKNIQSFHFKRFIILLLLPKNEKDNQFIEQKLSLNFFGMKVLMMLLMILMMLMIQLLLKF